ncbi:MAG TPA: hypothetical protein VMV29_03685 [Ktedonobacterales bacterium]|nr:hypothetical protein [Ktedonobacterales bacterium]
MLGPDHRLAAEDIDATLPSLTASAAGERANRMIIEAYFGSAFHWIAFKSEQLYSKHKNNHSKLVSFLRDVGEPGIGDRWRVLEEIRNGSWYGHRHITEDVTQAEAIWQEIHTWASN